MTLVWLVNTYSVSLQKESADKTMTAVLSVMMMRRRIIVCLFFSFLSEKEKENGVKSPACISQGCYSFSFKFIIPDKYLPTSFEGRHGNIRYWVRAVIDRGLGKSNVKTKPAPFMIGDYVALEDFENVSVRRVHFFSNFFCVPSRWYKRRWFGQQWMDISYLPTDLTSTIVFKTVYLVFT